MGNDGGWIQARGEWIYRALTGCLPAKLLVLFKIRIKHQDTICHLEAIELRAVVNSGHRADLHHLVTIDLGNDARELTIVN